MTPDPAQVDVAALRAHIGDGRRSVALPTDSLLALIDRLDRAEAEEMYRSAELDRCEERLWRLAAKAGWVPGNPADNNATAEQWITDALDEVEDLRAKVAAVEALADELANPDATLITPIERAHRRTVSRELRDALRLKGDG